MNGGCEMIIANGLKNFPLSNFSYEKEKFTRFIPKDDIKTKAMDTFYKNKR